MRLLRLEYCKSSEPQREDKMDKDEFAQWIFANYTIDYDPMARELLENVLDYAEGMGLDEQYNYLCRMIPQVPKSVIRTVSY